MRTIFMDFLGFVFLIGLISFVIIFFVAGDRMAYISIIMKAILPLLVFLVLFLFETKKVFHEIKKFKKENNLEEIIIYFTKEDILKDYIMISLVPLICFGLAAFDQSFDNYDTIQISLALAYLFIVHKILFQKQEQVSAVCCATRINKIIDEVLIYFLPMIMLCVTAVRMSTDIIDIAQATFAFLLFFYWRKYLFRRIV
jgi:hypothetical protein